VLFDITFKRFKNAALEEASGHQIEGKLFYYFIAENAMILERDLRFGLVVEGVVPSVLAVFTETGHGKILLAMKMVRKLRASPVALRARNKPSGSCWK
jgi:hypothetical protein